MGVGAVALAALGAASMARTAPVLVVYLAATAALLLAWPFQMARLAVPALPVARGVRGRRSVPASRNGTPSRIRVGARIRGRWDRRLADDDARLFFGRRLPRAQCLPRRGAAGDLPGRLGDSERDRSPRSDAADVVGVTTFRAPGVGRSRPAARPVDAVGGSTQPPALNPRTPAATTATPDGLRRVRPDGARISEPRACAPTRGVSCLSWQPRISERESRPRQRLRPWSAITASSPSRQEAVPATREDADALFRPRADGEPSPSGRAYADDGGPCVGYGGQHVGTRPTKTAARARG